jgi:hypothetical protein
VVRVRKSGWLWRQAAQAEKRDLKGDVAERVGGEGGGDPNFRDHDARQRRADKPREIEDHRIDGKR